MKGDDEKDPPIVPEQYLGGMTVIDIGDVRVARGQSRRPHAVCKHRRMHYDPRERRIWCPDCERDIEPYDAFASLAERSHAFHSAVVRREKAVAEAEQFQLRSRAAKAIDEVWRGRNMVPACPTCGHGLLPEMFANGVGVRLGRDYATARIKAKSEKP